MNKVVLVQYYKTRGLEPQAAEVACEFVLDLENWLVDQRRLQTLESIDLVTLKTYVQLLIEKKLNQLDRLLALARYFFLINRNDLYLYFTTLFGALGVIDTIVERIKLFHGEKLANEVMEGLEHPPLGSGPEVFPQFTSAFMNQLESHLKSEACHLVLAGNNHQISENAFDTEKEYFNAASTLDDYLLGYQKRQVAILQEHCDQKKVWFEQTITQEVVDFAANNQEIMSAVREGDWLYTTKIPYDPDRYLKSHDLHERRYLACHCPFIREAIKNNSMAIQDKWCSCSAGFAKFPYETLMGRTLQVEVVNSVLLGDDICRFRINIAK